MYLIQVNVFDYGILFRFICAYQFVKFIERTYVYSQIYIQIVYNLRIS